MEEAASAFNSVFVLLVVLLDLQHLDEVLYPVRDTTSRVVHDLVESVIGEHPGVSAVFVVRRRLREVLLLYLFKMEVAALRTQMWNISHRNGAFSLLSLRAQPYCRRGLDGDLFLLIGDVGVADGCEHLEHLESSGDTWPGKR